MEINKIYNEDCLDTMKRMPTNYIDLVVTSPPYNTSRKGSSLKNACENIRYDDFDDCKSDGEYIQWTLERFNLFNKVLKKNGSVLYNISYSSELTHLIWLVISEIINKTDFTTADCIVWKKTTATPNSTSKNKLTRICEFIFVFCRKKELNTFNCNKEISSYRDTGQASYKNYYNYIEAKNNDGSNDIHKATYSTELVRKLLDLYAKKTDIIYDPFMGTGTTGVACVVDQYNFIGSEISKRYVDQSKKRIKTHINQTKLF